MRKRLGAWLAVWAGWTALALLLAVSASLTYRSTGRPANWSLSISRALAEWWLWAALTPAVAWLARRYRLEGVGWRRHLILHVFAGAVVALAKTVADRELFAIISGFRIYLLVSTIALQFVIYAGIVAATHGLEYYRRSRERETLERRLAETRLQLLGMQLQPHFLFNTLNTIAELVHHDPDTADDMIVGLSDLLRLTLQLENRQQITMREELSLLSRYLDIQRARFGDRLRTTVNVAEEVQEGLVPLLLLQPLVENAIRHGLAEHAAAGRIDIQAGRRGNRLVIEVTDDGARSASASTPARQGIGLANTRGRLEALHGPDFRLEFTRVPEGTRVIIDLPLRTDGAVP
jgi:hypothetical protein